MKVPEYVKDAIIVTAKANYEAYKSSEIVRVWLDRHNLLDKYNESFIDYCEYGNNMSEEFIKELESDGE